MVKWETPGTAESWTSSGSPRNSFILTNKVNSFEFSLLPFFSTTKPGQPASNSADRGREDQNTPVPFTCLATSESGQEPELGGEQSPDFLLASVTRDPHNYLFVVTLPTLKAKWGLPNFLDRSATCRCMGLRVRFKGHAISMTVEKYLKILSAQKHSFLRRLDSTQPGKTQNNEIKLSA